MELNNDDHDDDIDDQYFDNVREEEEDVYDKEVLQYTYEEAKGVFGITTKGIIATITIKFIAAAINITTVRGGEGSWRWRLAAGQSPRFRGGTIATIFGITTEFTALRTNIMTTTGGTVTVAL